MKQIADTVTLSFLEEDNKQRVIFRVFPLCTREGVLFSEGRETFPDEGGLRVVPDKREQSTFKDRMRTLGALCVVNLVSDGKELTKVRPNRNYSPMKGEVNQNAIYSDVICGFQPDAVFEVVTCQEERLTAALTQGALTPCVLIERNKVLYGPVVVAGLSEEEAVIASLKPFGNDAFLLHTVSLPDGTRHTLYWNPDNIVSWRLKRNDFKRRDRFEDDASEPYYQPIDDAPVELADIEPEPTEIEPPEAEQYEEAYDDIPVDSPADTPAEAPIETPEDTDDIEPTADGDLPIGTRLNILDETLAFDDQITQLDQPLSSQANLLSSANTALEADQDDYEEPDEPPARVTGTPIMRTPANRPRMRGQQEPMQHVVEQQLRQARAVRPGAELPPDAPYEPIDNPIEDLGLAIERAWQSEDVRRQAINLLAENDELTGQIFRSLQQSGREMHLLSAAQEQLEDIEAERLSLMMQLEKAKEEQKAYEKQLLESMSKQRTAAIDKLHSEIEKLESYREQLELSNRESGIERLNQALEMICDTPLVLLTPITGAHNTIQQMVDAVRSALSNNGFACTEDDVQSLMVNLGLFDQIKLRANSIADARLYAQTALEALGLIDASAMLMEGQSVALMFADSSNDMMTPVFAIREKCGSAPMSHRFKTILISGCDARCDDDASLPCPTVTVPPLSARTRVQTSAVNALKPTSMASLNQIIEQAQPLFEEGEKWFTTLEDDARSAGLSVDTATWQAMRRFVSVAARLMRGGFLGAADEAVTQWIAPLLEDKPAQRESLRRNFIDLPKTLEMLDL